MPEAQARRRRRRAGTGRARAPGGGLRRRVRVRFLGLRPRDEELRIVAGAEAGLLSSDWENLPHSAVEALSVGVPVVSTAVGGVPEVVSDGENGLLVPPGDPDDARGRDPPHPGGAGLRDRLAAAAKPSVERAVERVVYGRLEALLAEAATMSERPRVLFVGARATACRCRRGSRRSGTRSSSELDYRVIGAATRTAAGRATTVPACAPLRPRQLDGLLFYLAAAAPRARASFRVPAGGDLRVRSVLGAAALAGRALAGRRSPVIVEVHGDWRTFARLYGSPARRLIGPSQTASRAYAVRRADATRAVSDVHRGPRRGDARGAADARLHGVQRPLGVRRTSRRLRCPNGRRCLFVGALEAYKNIEGLAAAWRLVADGCPRRGS